MFELTETFKSKEYQIKHSSLAKISKTEVTYEQCRKYACEDICSNLTHLNLTKKSSVVEIPYGTEFHFIGRVNTNSGGYRPEAYYETFESRDFVSFTSINNKNISHYKGRVFFVYNIHPEDIVHIFPMDSDIKTRATSEDELTMLPSLWLTLSDLESLTLMFKVYNQITCKSKRNGQILKPFAVVAFDKLDDDVRRIADMFGIGCIIVHPDKDAINYRKDLLYDCWALNSIAPIMKKLYGIPVNQLLYLD